jgi:hypothetical protein
MDMAASRIPDEFLQPFNLGSFQTFVAEHVEDEEARRVVE